MQKIVLIAASFILAISAIGAEKEYRSPDEVSLPPQSQREVIGTWFDKDTHCTRSFEQVKTKIYYVLRCSDGSGGERGKELLRVGISKFVPKSGSRHGDHYIIETNGKLGIYDDQGIIDSLPKHPTLRP